MKTKSGLVLVILLFSLISMGQDIIKLKNGDEIQSQVNEVTDTEIKYKKYNNLDGPVYIKKKTEVAFIKYKNGEKEIITVIEDVNKYTEAPSGSQQTSQKQPEQEGADKNDLQHS